MFVSWFGPSKFRVTLTLNSTPSLHHLGVILFLSMASWMTFARLSWSPFLDSVVVSQLPAGAGPTASASMPRCAQPKGIGQFGRSHGQRSVNSFSLLCLQASGEFFFSNFEVGYIFKLLFNLTFCVLNRVKCFYFSSLSWLNSSTLLLLVWFRWSWETRE